MEIKVFYTMVAIFIVVGGLLLGGLWLLDTGTNTVVDTPVTSQEETLGAQRETPTQVPSEKKTIEKANIAISKDIKIDTFDADKLYSLINAYRRDNKLGTLKVHLLLEKSAQLKIADMEQNKYWTHKDPKGRDSWYMFEQVGYQFERAGENLAFGYTTPWQVFEQWQKSPEHNAQMLTPEYDHMGLAVDCDTYSKTQHTCVVVLHLGKQLL